MAVKRGEQIAQMAVVTLLVVACLLVLRAFVTALLSAAIMCYATWPAYERVLESLRQRRTLASLVMTLLLVLVIVLPLAFIAVTLADSVSPLVNWVRDALGQGLPLPPDWVRGIPIIGESADAWWRDLAASEVKLAELVKRFTHPAQQAAITTALVVGEGVLQLSLAAFFCFFFYRDGAALVAAARVLVQRLAGDLEQGLFLAVGGTIQSVIYGIIGTAVAQGLVALIGFLIAGIPGAVLLAFVTFMLSVVPVGPPLIWGGATAWLIYQDQIGWAIFMAAWGFFVISGIDNVIKPLLISRGSNLPFLLVIVGVFGGILAFGFVGIFLGPTLMAIAYTLALRWLSATAGNSGSKSN